MQADSLYALRTTHYALCITFYAQSPEILKSHKIILHDACFITQYHVQYGRSLLDKWGGGGMADAADLKSAGLTPVWVRLPPALFK
jgi:hypothetical protein